MTEPEVNVGQRDQDEDDHDLLTYGEVSARLTGEIAAAQQRLEELIAKYGDSEAEVDAARRRLDLLRDALERNRNSPSNLARFESAFGYRPKPDGV